MNSTSIVRVRTADEFPQVQSSIRERLTFRVNNEILCERIFIVVTIAMATFFSFICYHALQNYGAM